MRIGDFTTVVRESLPSSPKNSTEWPAILELISLSGTPRMAAVNYLCFGVLLFGSEIRALPASAGVPVLSVRKDVRLDLPQVSSRRGPTES